MKPVLEPSVETKIKEKIDDLENGVHKMIDAIESGDDYAEADWDLATSIAFDDLRELLSTQQAQMRDTYIDTLKKKIEELKITKDNSSLFSAAGDYNYAIDKVLSLLEDISDKEVGK